MNLLNLLTYSLLLASALGALCLKDVIHSVIALSIFSVLLCLVFAIHYAPDVAIAEAVVGAGITTGFYILTVSHTAGAKKR